MKKLEDRMHGESIKEYFTVKGQWNDIFVKIYKYKL